ncbi:putative RNase H-like HicB family nuclease [Paenibacillus sp. LBL]|uniref:type II toxin-antitoxin system HicB family antitoxin n=1 Tax=Paenibacillus sp. LBL TaxID=2940563 RepID=UPI00247720EA|nr:type II toxin-antitoxin system HicB family antitoxin [Paenibacillus sp. LBL]MDH6675617.1 putative RNase H-like HicB family nuclease [Paenibacillus sp. LBL]
MSKAFTILVEEDYASRNFSAYVPELRLNVVGDTEEDVISSVKDLISAELEKPLAIKTFAAKIVSVNIETIQSGKYANA